MLIGVAAFRWIAWSWLTVVAIVNLHRVGHPAVVLSAIVAMGVITGLSQMAVLAEGGRRAADRRLIVAEVAVAVAVVAADGWVRQGRVSGQSLAGPWPLAAILVSGLVAGPFWGAGVGGLLGIARAAATAVAGSAPGQGGRATVATASTVLFWVAVGAVSGGMVRVLRRTQDQLSEAAAREGIARDLHDSVLQTLAIIERRSPNEELALLARDQERELRAYLFGDHRAPPGLAAELRAVAGRAERRWPGTTVTVAVTDDVPVLAVASIKAAAGAVAEAITNAAKHGGAHRVVVFADVDDGTGGLFLTVKDDGSGFDLEALAEGVGIRESIRGRIEGVGGVAVLASAPGDGCEVRLQVPSRQKR
jgi:signal transduction histidine kinase